MSETSDRLILAPQIDSECPSCGATLQSFKNWAVRGKGGVTMRVYAFRCPCGDKFRRAKRET